MAKREKLGEDALRTFLEAHPGWALGEGGASLEKTFSFPRYADGIALAVRLGFEAERRDHHPDLFLGWRKARVAWSTHDAGGITALDLELAELTDALADRL